MTNDQALEGLNQLVNNTRDTLTAQQQQLLSFTASTNNTITQISVSLQKYVQDYVAAYWQANTPVK